MLSQFSWTVVRNKDELERFYRGIIPNIRAAARAEGYAIGLHGSIRRDLDLIAVPWEAVYSDANQLARAIHRSACGIENQAYRWERKPNGRVATCFPVCFPEFPEWTGELSLGHIDLSVFAVQRKGD